MYFYLFANKIPVRFFYKLFWAFSVALCIRHMARLRRFRSDCYALLPNWLHLNFAWNLVFTIMCTFRGDVSENTSVIYMSKSKERTTSALRCLHPKNSMPSKVLPAICALLLLFEVYFTDWPIFRLADKYFQLAASVMLFYDHSKLIILSKPRIQVYIFPSAYVWPGGLSAILLRLENLILNYYLGRSHLEAEDVGCFDFIPDQ